MHISCWVICIIDIDYNLFISLKILKSIVIDKVANNILKSAFNQEK